MGSIEYNKKFERNIRFEVNDLWSQRIDPKMYKNITKHENSCESIFGNWLLLEIFLKNNYCRYLKGF